MATTSTVSYRKIDSQRLSFFDLPTEVRDKVYEEYFALPERLTIHLIQEEMKGDKGYTNIDRMRVSTKYHAHLSSNFDQTPDLSVLIVYDDEQITIEELLATASQRDLLWSNLESTTSSLNAEAGKHSYRHTMFTILGGEGCDILYHSNLRVIPNRLLSKIKNLELDDSILAASFESDSADAWNAGIWPILLDDMVNLQHLSFEKSSCMLQIVKLLTMGHACFLGPRPKIIFVVNREDCNEDYWDCDIISSGAIVPLTLRFVVPPLKTITFRDDVLPRFNGSAGWDESRLKLIKSTPQPPRGVERIYELTWPEA